MHEAHKDFHPQLKKALNFGIRTVVSSIALLALAAISATHARATIGLAEWQIETPGGNLISYIDPIKDEYSTCLRRADETPGLLYDVEVYVSHLKWWQYYAGHVIGKGRKGYFIFNEVSRNTDFFATREVLEQTVEQRRLGAPRSTKMTPGHGWEMVWGAEFEKRDPHYRKKRKDERRRTCAILAEQVQRHPGRFSIDEREEIEIMCDEK